ncbi:MAG: DUF3237 family protein [Verrucomicrobia bacterium]|nr:DUF3237 family protein [Verrucomicrobiota bacterium]MBV8278708.1 DUF3237 family protein [Verrucomicrobiota bacterium]
MPAAPSINTNAAQLILPQLELLTVMELSQHTPMSWLRLAKGMEPVIRTSGSFSGPRLNGVVLKNIVTGKYNPLLECIELFAQAELLTNDGAKIYKTDHGCWRGEEGAVSDLVSGKSVPVSRFYFIGVLNYAVSHPGYAWLQEGNYLSHGAIDGGKLKISQYRVVNSEKLADLKARVDANRPRS